MNSIAEFIINGNLTCEVKPLSCYKVTLEKESSFEINSSEESENGENTREDGEKSGLNSERCERHGVSPTQSKTNKECHQEPSRLDDVVNICQHKNGNFKKPVKNNGKNALDGNIVQNYILHNSLRSANPVLCYGKVTRNTRQRAKKLLNTQDKPKKKPETRKKFPRKAKEKVAKPENTKKDVKDINCNVVKSVKSNEKAPPKTKGSHKVVTIKHLESRHQNYKSIFENKTNAEDDMDFFADRPASSGKALNMLFDGELDEPSVIKTPLGKDKDVCPGLTPRTAFIDDWVKDFDQHKTPEKDNNEKLQEKKRRNTYQVIKHNLPAKNSRKRVKNTKNEALKINRTQTKFTQIQYPELPEDSSSSDTSSDDYFY